MRLPYLKYKQAQQAQGFTLIELLFAMTAFSIMLVVAVSGFLNAMWIYNQATISRDNQQQVRSIVDSIGRNIRTATYADIPGAGATAGILGLPSVLDYSSLCLEGTVDGTIYYYRKNDHLFVRNVQTCRSGAGYLDPSEPANPSIFLSEEKDLVAGGAATKLWTPYGSQGMTVWKFEQPALAPSTVPVQTVRIELGLRRGSNGALTARERQFSNDFWINSTFYLRNQGS